MISADDIAFFERLQVVANEQFDGHLTVMKFATNWRVGFGTPMYREDIDGMASGKTFIEAAREALREPTRCTS